MRKSIEDVSIQDIYAAREQISHDILETPLREVHVALGDLKNNLFLKMENEQRTGSFKLRGATNKMRHLTPEERAKGVIAASAGNHAQGVAYSATRLGIKSKIVMPVNSPLVKVNATQGYGAEIVLHGDYFDQAFQKARELEQAEGRTFIHAYEDPYVIAGQGTIGLEILEDLPDVENVIIPMGGGGLMSGISLAIKSLNPKIKVFGAVSEAAPGMRQLFRHEDPVIKKIPTIADGIAVKSPSASMYKNFIAKYVDDIFEVNDEEIALAMVFLLEKLKTVTEGSGAAGFATLLSEKLKLKGKTCVILSGGNVDLNTISQVIETGLRKAGRLARVSVIVNDLPGNLHRLTEIVAKHNANIIEVDHDRVHPQVHMRETKIDFVLELKTEESLKKILQDFKELPGTRFQ